MPAPTQFENEDILNSTMLSGMAYLKDKFIREGVLLQKRSVSKIQISKFLQGHKANKKNVTTVKDLQKYEELYLKAVIDNAGYRNVITQKTKFYENFKEELGLEGKSERAIASAAKKDAIHETRLAIVKILLKELRLSNIEFTLYKESLEEFPTQLTLRYADNPYEKAMNRDIKQLWHKFTPIPFSEEIKNKYKLYDPKNDSAVIANFNNGYIEAGRLGECKDGCLLTGYVKSKGRDILYISFRGTEQKVKPAFKYFLENYPNMERQYNYFDPIIKEIIQDEIEKNKIKNPGKKLEVIFTGHSLGASLAEKALDKFQDNDDVSYKGIFISNPGSFHYLQNVINKLDEWDSHFDKMKYKSVNSMKASVKNSFMSIGADVMKAAVKASKASVLLLVGFTNYSVGAVRIRLKPAELEIKDFQDKYFMDDVAEFSTSYCASFMNTGLQAVCGGVGRIVKKLLLSPFVDKKHADPRACTINHKMDNIPQIGKALFQNYNPQNIILSDPLPEIDNKNMIGEIFQIDYHGREVYYAELKKEAKEGNLYTPPVKKERKLTVVDRIKNLRENLFTNKSTENKNAFKV